MENFQELKSIILYRAKEKGAYLDNYRRACESENMEQLCEVIKANFWWVCRNGVLDVELIEKYKDAFAANKIYANASVSEGFVLAWGNATVKALGNATVKAWDNATVKALGNAYINCCASISCTISDNAIIRRWDTNTIQYASDDLTFEKIGSAESE